MKSPLKRVNTRTMMWPLEDGSTESRPVTLWLDPRGDTTFVYKLPEYVSSALGCGAEVRATTAGEAYSSFEKVVRKYVDWYRTAKAEPVIILNVEFYGKSEEGHLIKEGKPFFGGMRDEWIEARAVGVRYTLAFRVNGNLHYRDTRWDGERESHKVGSRMSRGADGQVIDYTPEVHAKIDLICSAVNRAAQQLDTLIKSKNLATALLTSNFGALPAPKKDET